MIKKYLFLILIIFYGMLFCTKINAAETLDKIVAVVNDSPITQTELNHSVDAFKKQLAGTNNPLPADGILQKQVLEQIINRKLQLLLAEQNGVNTTDAEVDQAVGMIANEHQISKDELFKKVHEQGMNVADYRKEIRDQVTMQHIQQVEVGSKITVTPHEVDEFMRSKLLNTSNSKEYHLEDILIDLPETPTPQDIAEAKKQAELMITKIQQSNFHTAAAASDLGWRNLAQVPSVFVKSLSSMKTNEVTGPIQAPNGFHILHLAGVRDADTHKEKVTHEEAQRLLFQHKFEEALETWTRKLRSEAFVKIYT